MGTESFLLGSREQTFANIQRAIDDLRDASELFVIRFNQGELKRAGEISSRAFECFDHIVGEFLRIRDDRKGAGTYVGTLFERKMNAQIALMVEPAQIADQAAVAAAAAGQGRLPASAHLIHISLEKTLNKIKHRNRTNLNFRIEGGRHILVVCPNRPDSIVELDVVKFCDLCRDTALEL